MNTKKLILLIWIIASVPIVQAKNKLQIENKTNFTIGEVVEFHSDILKENRILNIYLPNSYAKAPNKRYPVIYLLDGSANEDFVHIAGIVQFGSFSWINMLPESIVVGIANVDRKKDFTFASENKLDRKEFPSSGNSENFIKSVENEIQPLITKSYRTNSKKTIIGQSLGGLLAAEILLKRPQLFDHYIIISPSLWWDDGSLLKVPLLEYNTPKSVYVGVGKEGKLMEKVAKLFYEKINHEKKKGTSVYYNYFEQLDHGDTLHLAAYDAFKKMFKQSKPGIK